MGNSCKCNCQNQEKLNGEQEYITGSVQKKLENKEVVAPEINAKVNIAI